MIENSGGVVLRHASHEESGLMAVKRHFSVRRRGCDCIRGGLDTIGNNFVLSPVKFFYTRNRHGRTTRATIKVIK